MSSGAILIAIAINLLTTVFAVLCGRGWQRYKDRKLQRQRLSDLHQTAHSDEIAICVRVGGNSDPLEDVRRYLSEHQPKIQHILFYSATSTSSADVAQTTTAVRVIDDICEGIREYGLGHIKRVHLFPSGMIAYQFPVGALIGNWGQVIVYNYAGSKYEPLYTISKEQLHKQRITTALKSWVTHPVKLVSSPKELVGAGTSDKK